MYFKQGDKGGQDFSKKGSQGLMVVWFLSLSIN